MMIVRVGSVAQRADILSEMLKTGSDPATPCLEFEPDEVMHMREPAEGSLKASDSAAQDPDGIRLSTLGSYKRPTVNTEKKKGPPSRTP
jgi:hypothetical protein